MRAHIPETPTTKALVVVLCSYEVAAITTGRFPTITAMNRRSPLIGCALLAALAIHFWINPEESP